ncbi:MAG: PAS domain-containing protein [Firmicutes bacterium]|nr:PAS domain-containing protein [Bacillota bacterium]
MEKEKMLEYILDSYPYKVVFVDTDFIIRYLNKAAKYHYYDFRGYDELIGKSLFECHNEASVEKIKQAVEKLKNHANEMYLGVTVDNQRFYLNPVRDEKGRLVGFFERFELNLQK